MTPIECMRLLGLGETARLSDIKHAYRQLAQRLHPDKHHGSEAARQRFIEVSNAYRMLVRTARAVEAGRSVGNCTACLTFGEVVRGLDGFLRCPRCSVTGRRRFLPLPVWQVVRCTLAILLMTGSAVLIVEWLHRPAFSTAAGALALALLGLAALAATCLRVKHCLPSRRPPQR